MKTTSLILVCLSFLISGCGDCFSYEYSVTDIVNSDTADQTVEFCRADNQNEVKSMSIMPGERKEFEWGHQKIYNRSDASSLCHDQYDEEAFVEILLTSQAQNTFRLCKDNIYDVYSVVLRAQACPVDSTEVTDSCL